MTSYGLCFRATPDFPARRRWEWSEPSSPEPVSFLPGPPHPAAAGTAVDTIDYSDSLPDEVLLLVLSRLRSRVDRNAAAAVCKRWLQVEAGLRTALHLSVTECSPSRTPKPERGCMDRVLLYMLGRLTNLREIQLVNLRRIHFHGKLATTLQRFWTISRFQSCRECKCSSLDTHRVYRSTEFLCTCTPGLTLRVLRLVDDRIEEWKRLGCLVLSSGNSI